jgi:hypothetical protein
MKMKLFVVSVLMVLVGVTAAGNRLRKRSITKEDNACFPATYTFRFSLGMREWVPGSV